MHWGMVLFLGAALTLFYVLGFYHGRRPLSGGGYLQPSRPYNPVPPSLRPLDWHPTYIAVQACKAFANHAIDESRPIKDVWMCGVSTVKDARLCHGYRPADDIDSTRWLCQHRQASTGACLLAGRRTCREELIDDA